MRAALDIRGMMTDVILTFLRGLAPAVSPRVPGMTCYNQTRLRSLRHLLATPHGTS